MRLYPGRAVLFALLFSVAAQAAPLIPAEYFARAPFYSAMSLAPDGGAVGFLHETDGKKTLYFMEGDIEASGRWKGKTPLKIEPDRAHFVNSRKEIDWFRWVSNRRVVFRTTVWGDFEYGKVAADRDGKRQRAISGLEAKPEGTHLTYLGGVLFSKDDDPAHVLMVESRTVEGDFRISPNTDVVEVNTLTGSLTPVVRNLGSVFAWWCDPSGLVRVGLDADKKTLKTKLWHRRSEKDSWSVLNVGDRENAPLPVGFDETGENLFVTVEDAHGVAQLRSVDLANGRLGSVIASDPVYDISQLNFSPRFDGKSLEYPVFREDKNELEGVYYVAEGPKVIWLKDEAAARQAAIDRALPNTLNLIRGRSSDERRFLILAYSDRDPGSYYIFDAKAGSLTALGARMPWLKAEEMSGMHPISLKARDGLMLHGYLTVPHGMEPKRLPLVVLPHGGPQARDVWGFDPLVQFLASRGYAVLQVNYRGSSGYGEEFFNRVRHQVGAGIENDIEDATRWAIKGGVADPHRIAIVGASYGGYSALFALGKTPDLYRCGISIAGVSDWIALFKEVRESDSPYSYRYWKQQLGDVDVEGERLAVVSPVNFAAQIQKPLLIAHGNEDHTVPVSQGHRLVSALEKAGARPETVFYSDTDHYFASEKVRTDLYTRIERFLAKNMTE